jgi:hypothetical protein
MKPIFDLQALEDEIALERLRIKSIKYSPENYGVLCKLLTKLKYHTNDDTKNATILRSKKFNLKKKNALTQNI